MFKSRSINQVSSLELRAQKGINSCMMHVLDCSGFWMHDFLAFPEFFLGQVTLAMHGPR